MGWTDQHTDNSCSQAVSSVCMHVSKRKADTLNTQLSSSLAYTVGRQMLGVMNNFQPLPAFMLIFIAMVIRFCVDSIELILVLVIAHRKRVVWNFIGLALSIAWPNMDPTFLHKFLHFYWFIQSHTTTLGNHDSQWRCHPDDVLTSYWRKHYTVKAVHTVEILTALHTALYLALTWKFL